MDVHTLLRRALESSHSSATDYENRGHIYFIIATPLVIVGILTMFGRIYCRAVILKRMGGDDWCMIFALIAALVIFITNSIAVSYGLGRHTWTSTPEEQSRSRMVGYYIAMMHYFLALGLTKCSLLLFLIRLTYASRLSKVSWILLWFVVAYTVVAFVLSAIQCIPVSYIWEYLLPSTPKDLKVMCLSQRPLNYTLFSINIFTDLVIWLLPLRTIQKIQVPPRQKCALFVIFSLGSLSVLAGFIRLLSVEKSINTTDPTWDNLNLGIWSLVEVLIGIICGSAPVTKPLFSKFLPRMLGSGSKSTDNSRRPSRQFPGIRSHQQTAYVLGSVNTAGTTERSSSMEEFGPTTRIEGRGSRASSEIGNEELGQGEEDLGSDGILRCTEVQVKYEERV